MIWMIVTEDIDGQWFGDPKVFPTRERAEKWASSHQPPDGYCHILYSRIGEIYPHELQTGTTSAGQ